jgi:hypothetical protein
MGIGLDLQAAAEEQNSITFDKLVKAELEKARRKHPDSYPSAHYFYAVILEEVDEFWDLVKAQNPDKAHMLKELVQIGAMAQRAAEDIGLIDKPQ